MHLSQRLKWIFVITRCPSSVVRRELFTFSTSSLKLLNRIQQNLTGSKISTSSTKFVFFGPIGKTRWLPWPLIGWDIFDFYSETAERNSTKLDRKQDLNVLCQVCVFWADQKKKMAALAIFDFFSETAEWNSMKLDRKQDLNVLYEVCVFQADRKNKTAALASDWLRHFRLLLWNCWMEFNKTWMEARSQHLLPSLCFSGRLEKQDGCPGLWLAETFSTSPLKLLNGIQWNLTGSKISMPSIKFVFFGPIGKTRWLPWPLIGWAFSTSPLKLLNGIQWNLTGSKISMPSIKFVFFGPIGKTRWLPRPLIGWDIFYFSSETAERNSMKLDRKQDLNVLYRGFIFGQIGKTRWPLWPILQKGGTLYSGARYVALWASCLTLLPPGAYCSVSQTHLDFFLFWYTNLLFWSTWTFG